MESTHCRSSVIVPTVEDVVAAIPEREQDLVRGGTPQTSMGTTTRRVPCMKRCKRLPNSPMLP